MNTASPSTSSISPPWPSNISVALMTHPRRQDLVKEFCATHSDIPIEIVVDPLPDAASSDGAALRTSLLAWDRARSNSNATHHMVLQDDIILHDDFIPAVTAMTGAMPQSALSLFSEWRSPTSTAVRIAALSGQSWATVLNWYIPTEALILPTHVASNFRSYVAKHIDALETPDDVAILQYLHDIGCEPLVAAPNIVQQLEVESLVGNIYPAARLSGCYSTLPLDRLSWRNGVCYPVLAPHYSRRHSAAMCMTRERSQPHDYQLVEATRVLEELLGLPHDIEEIQKFSLELIQPTCDKYRWRIVFEELVHVVRQVRTIVFLTGYATRHNSDTIEMEPRLELDQVRVSPFLPISIYTTGMSALLHHYVKQIAGEIWNAISDDLQSMFELGFHMATEPTTNLTSRAVDTASRAARTRRAGR